jgi:hypothetical protein
LPFTFFAYGRILVFDKSTIVENGTHQEFLFKDGLYKALGDAQVDGSLPDNAITGNKLIAIVNSLSPLFFHLSKFSSSR